MKKKPNIVLIKRFDGPNNRGIGDELYDVQNDPDETINLSGDPQYGEIEAFLATKLNEFFSQYARPDADLWHGGVPIQNSIRQKFWRKSWGDSWAPVYSYDKKPS